MTSPAAGESSARGWGSPALRRATVVLGTTQIISWGVLFYGFAVVAPDISAGTGWSEAAVAGAFSTGLLVAGLAAPFVARALASYDPRLVLTAGSFVGAAAMVAFATAHSLAGLYAAWIVAGVAMAVTFYEPAMAVLVALDPARRVRTLTSVAVAGGLASTVFAPLTGFLADALGWRDAIALLGVAGGLVTAILHAAVLPPPSAHPQTQHHTIEAAAPGVMRGSVARLRTAALFEQAALVATTVHLVGVLAHRGAPVTVGAAALAAMGIGKVAGRLLLLGPSRNRSLPLLAAGCSLVQLTGFTAPLVTTAPIAVLPIAVVVGAASGASTVLRPLLVVDLVGAGRFAAVNARIQRAAAFARSGAPFVLGAAIATLGWSAAWLIALGGFAVAAERFRSLHRAHDSRPPARLAPGEPTAFP
jgi:predicted MFS family arabinose efflux permease